MKQQSYQCDRITDLKMKKMFMDLKTFYFLESMLHLQLLL